VRARYLALAAAAAGRIVVVDAGRTADAVAADVARAVAGLQGG